MNRKVVMGLFIFVLVTGIMALVSPSAKANITITPTIIVIEGRDRYADLYVLNTTNERQSYEIHWKFLQQQENLGNYKNVDKPTTAFDLSKNIIFTPRRISLAPKSGQKVRLGLRLQGTPPPPGDYRAHIELLNTSSGRDASPDVEIGPQEQQLQVNMKVAFSIPVIYRVGNENGGDGVIGNVTTQINPKTNKIEAVIPITRAEGAYGTLGTIAVNYGGKRVGQLRNANIFPEIKTRIFHVPLDVQTLSGGSLNIVYSDYDLEKKIIFDEKNINIAQ